MARKPSKHRAPWTSKEAALLEKLSSRRTVRELAKQLNRTPAAVQQRALKDGVSFRKAKRRAGVRKKK